MFPLQLQNAISYAVGTTLVCDTLEEAQDLCFTRGERVKVVTLRGHSIGKSGAMTGGAAAREGQDRWEEKEVDVLKKRKAELEGLIAQITGQAPTRQKLLDVETKLRLLQSKVKLNETDLKVIREKVAHLQQQKTLRSDHKKRLHKDIDVLKTEVRALEKQLSQVFLSDEVNHCLALMFVSYLYQDVPYSFYLCNNYMWLHLFV
jgi:structural maintenance of chromosome 1